jgi:hypothetical protein
VIENMPSAPVVVSSSAIEITEDDRGLPSAACTTPLRGNRGIVVVVVGGRVVVVVVVVVVLVVLLVEAACSRAVLPSDEVQAATTRASASR